MAAWNMDTALNSNPALLNQVTFIQNQITNQATVAAVEGQLEDAEFDNDSLAGLLLTSINGDFGMPEQRVTVEYLTASQTLLIPAALAMSITNNVAGQTPTNTVLFDRYKRLTNYTMTQLRGMMNDAPNAVAFRTAFETGEVPPLADRNWETEAAYIPDMNPPLNRQHRNVFFALVSGALQFNCDIRDMGILMKADMRMPDNQHTIVTPITRLNVRMQPFTLQCIASLNYPQVANFAIGAWVRAIGVGAGILPTETSLSIVEYKFVHTRPATQHRNLVTATERIMGSRCHALCMNIIALFGLMHLNKDHTYRTNDSAMNRIGTSYINTLRTLAIDNEVKDMIANMESTVRTAAHPFGLGQTYAVARIMAEHNRLAPALALRRSVTPPPVQRFFIARAAYREWGALPVGVLLNEMYAPEIDAVDQVCTLVEAAPSKFSALHRLYGYNELATFSDDAQSALSKILPCVVGYADSQHGGEGNSKKGMALALSLDNIRKGNESLCNAFKHLWDNYMDTMEKDGLLKLAGMATVQR